MSHSPNRRPIWKFGALSFVVVSLLLTWLFTGVVLGYSDEQPRASFFLKKYPTFKIQFPNPDDSESDYLPFPELPLEEREAITAYCKYRFGVASTEISKIEACRQGIL